MTNADKREKYKRLRSERRCTRCGTQDERTLSGRSCCEKCRGQMLSDEYRKEYQHRHRQKYLDEKRCGRCGAQDERTLAGYGQCERCRERQKEYYSQEPMRERRRMYMMERYYRLKDAGLCVNCGEPVVSGAYCEKCKKINRLRERERKHGQTEDL